MTFEEILSPFIYGKKIRRASWGKDFWIESNGSTVFQKAYDPIGKCDFVVQHYAESDKLFSVEDTLANDWEIYR